MGRSGGLAELLRDSLGSQELPAAPPKPIPEAAADTLREHYAALQRRVELKPGQVVTYKVGLDPRAKGDMEQPLLYLGELADEYPKEGLHYRFGKADVVVIGLHDDGTACFMGTDRRWLEPWPRASAPQS